MGRSSASTAGSSTGLTSMTSSCGCLSSSMDRESVLARIAQQAQGIDLFPTVAGLLGFPAPPGLPGLDVFALSKDRPVFSETRFGNTPPGSPTELISVRTSGWKLIYAPALGYSELYDLARDPGERVDRSRIAAEGNALAELLSGWSASAPPPPRSVGHDP